MIVLWTTTDIAAQLGISKSLVANWGNGKARDLPEPYAVTNSGTRLFTREQAEEVIAEYRAWDAARAARRADLERAEKALERMAR
ncbi:helix-turn-helix DNA binding domain protein [Arthrobacter phage Pureglobe5]|nr:DNA binding domain protein [Arthrobacter phage Beagle]QOP66809.1 helix-turn-helix DNA binding domain protein [Arthrobacter phage Odyssey395]UYL87422.1 helix-turn-helix DNA binding domain protein [Arthrobacter phage Pureglobe5]